MLDTLAAEKFGSKYDSKRGLIYIDYNYYLKKEVGQIHENLLNNPHINFFAKSNPEYFKGVELACIVPLSLSNINDRLKTFLKEEP